MTMVQTEPGLPQYASQNTATSRECGVALHGEALSLSSYWTLASWRALSFHSGSQDKLRRPGILFTRHQKSLSQSAFLEAELVETHAVSWVTGSRPRLWGWALFWNTGGPWPCQRIQRTCFSKWAVPVRLSLVPTEASPHLSFSQWEEQEISSIW